MVWAPDGEDPLLGKVLDGRYRIGERLGEGAMGDVYAAERVGLARRCVVKVLRPHLADDRRAVERFTRESVAASAIGHENIVEVFDTGTTPDGLAYYVMEYLRGETLSSTLRREGRLAWPRVRDIVLQLCGALATAHARGIVHRDLKPDNCLRIQRAGNQDFIKILDFGVAKFRGADPTVARRITHSGEIIGTACYMAPEQLCGKDVDGRADVYAIGVIMVQLLTGVTPFSDVELLDILDAKRRPALAPIRSLVPDAALPDELDALVRRTIEPEPDDRFPDMESLTLAILELEATGRTAHLRTPLPQPRAAESGALAFQRTVVGELTPPSRERVRLGPAEEAALAAARAGRPRSRGPAIAVTIALLAALALAAWSMT